MIKLYFEVKEEGYVEKTLKMVHEVATDNSTAYITETSGGHMACYALCDLKILKVDGEIWYEESEEKSPTIFEVKYKKLSTKEIATIYSLTPSKIGVYIKLTRLDGSEFYLTTREHKVVEEREIPKENIEKRVDEPYLEIVYADGSCGTVTPIQSAYVVSRDYGEKYLHYRQSGQKGYIEINLRDIISWEHV